MSLSRLDPNDVAVAQWAYEHGQLAGAGTDNLPRGRMLFVPLRASRGGVGVLGIRPSRPGALDDAESRRLLEAFANQIALAIERSLLAEEAQRAQLRVEAEQLRNSLLSSVSHDLQTPLTVITGAASTLVAGGETLDAATRQDLVETIHERSRPAQPSREQSPRHDAAGVRRGAGASRVAAPRRAWSARRSSAWAGTWKGTRSARTSPPTLPLVPIDGVLIEQVFFNLLDNAVKYTPEGCPIEITARASTGARHRVVRRSRSRAAGRRPRPRVREVLSGEAGGGPRRSGTRAHDLSGDRQRARRTHLGGESSRRRPRLPLHASPLRRAAGAGRKSSASRLRVTSRSASAASRAR